MAVVTREEFQEWLESPVTKALKERIAKDIDYMKDMLVDCSQDTLQELQGRCKACTNLLNVDYEALYD